MRKKFLLMTFLTLLFTAMGTSVLRAQELYVSCDYNSSTEGWGTTRFSNYAGAYAYATANATSATIVVEKTNTLSGNCFDNNHKNYSNLKVVIKDGAAMGNAASKWDMTYPVTVEPGGTLTCARPKTASVSYIHIKNTLTVGAEGAEKEAYVDFLSDTYQDCDISIRYNGKINVYNSVFRVQDLDAQGTLTIKDSEVYVDGAFASATFFATTLTNTTMTVNGNQISGGISDFAGGDSNQLGKVTLNNSTITINEGTTKVAATVTANGSEINVNDLTINSGKKVNLNGGSVLDVETLNIVGTGSVVPDETSTIQNNGQIIVAMIGQNVYTSLADALSAASAMTGDVTVEIYEKVTLNQPLAGSYSSIKFLAKDTDAEIYLDVQGYITATGKEVAFEGLTLSKSQGGYITNAGFMNVAFGVYDVTKVTYTNCTFDNGAYASSGNVTYTGCIFKRSHDKYGLWAYGNVDITVDGCTFDDYRGIKMYAEGAAKTVDLTVKNTNFSAVNDKPAIVLTYGESVTLENNTYSSTGTFELDLDGAPNGTTVTSDVDPICKNDNGDCGVLCDGKIYTTVAQAAEVATSGSTVTLLHDSTETVELPAGVILDKNGYEAAGITVTQPVAKIGETPYYTLAEAVAAAQSGATITLLNGEHELPLFAGKELTFKGESKEGVIVNDAPAATTQGWNGSTFHFENLTAKGATANYHGLANGVVSVTYKDCNINGLRFLYSPTTFEDCAFNANGVEHSFWTYGASNVTVKNSPFTYTDRAVNCYSENGANHELDITFTGCTFTYAGTNATPEGAVEINSGSVKSIDLVMNGCTAPANGAMWFNSQWDSADGLKTVVVVDGVVVWTAPAKIGETRYATLEAAVNAAQDGEEIDLLKDVELTSTLLLTKNNILDGNGFMLTPAEGFTYDGNNAVIVLAANMSGYEANRTYTVKNLTIKGFSTPSRIVRANFCDATIQNCLFNNNTSESIITSAYAVLNVEDNTFTNNTPSFAVINVGSDVSDGTNLVAKIIDNTFENNQAAIAGIFLASSADVTDNHFKDNTHTGDNANAAAILAGPYTGDMAYTVNINSNAFENAMSKDGTALPSVFAEDWSSLGSATSFDLSLNYWDGNKPEAGTAYKTSGDNPQVTVKSYYTTYTDEILGGLIELPQGNNFTGYTRGDAIWGEVWGNATTSFVIKVLDANGNVMGTTSLNNVDGIINGNVNVTWSLKLDAASNTDEYWDMSWATAPTIDNMPAKVELWVDGVKVSGGNVVLNGPDEIQKIYAAVTDANGMILSYHTSIAAAVAAITNTRSNPQGYIALLRDTDEEITLPAGIVLDKNGFIADNIVIPVASVNGTSYATLAGAVAAVQEGQTIQLLADEISEGTIKLPATLKNVTFKGAADHASVLKDMTIMAADGNSFNYEGLTFDGIYFNNSRISLTGWRNGDETIKDLTVTNCWFKNLDDTSNSAPLHINKEASEAINGLTFTNNVIDGAIGGQKSGVYAQTTGEVVFTGNIINNVSFRPYIIQLTTDDGVADTFTVTGNKFSGSAAGRAQGLGNNAVGTDAVSLTISNNIFEDITNAQQICYWNFNEAKTTAVLEKNYYDIDIEENPDRIYFNSAAQDAYDLLDMGIFPIYTELNADGTINTESEYTPNIPFAQIGETGYPSLEAAAAAAQAGDEILLLANVTLSEALTTPAGITLNGNGKQINGSIVAGGDLTIKGHTKATSFNAGYNQPIITIGAGACLEMNGTGRMVIGHGATFNITGTIEDAKTADKATLVPSLKIAAGASITGNGVTFNVNNAYIVANANTTSKNSNANGTLDFNINNSIWEQTGVLAFYVPTSGMDPVVNFELKNSVLNSTSHLVFAVTKGDVVFDNSNVNVGTSRQIENRSTMTVKNGSVVNGAVATSENAKNPGTLIVDDATYAVTGEFSGSNLGTGTLIVNKTANFSAGSITNANIQIDATGMIVGDVVNITANLNNHTGTIEVINDNMLDAKIVDGKIVIVERTLQGEGTADNPYLINDISDLEFFRDDVNAGNNYTGKYIKVTATEIDLNNEEWTPIAYMGKTFKGNFDGNNVTVKNLKITKALTNSAENNNIGFFGRTDSPATIEYITIENVDITGSLYVGAIVGLGYTGKHVKGCTVKGNIAIDAWWYAGVIGGNGYMNLVDDCHVIGNNGSYIKGNDGSYIGGIWGFRGEGNNKITNCTVTNLDIIGVDRVGGICGIGHYGNTISGCDAEDVTVTATDPEATTIGLLVGATQGNVNGPTIFENNDASGITAQIDNGDGTYTEVTNLYGTNIDGTTPVTNYVAQIVGGTQYATLAEAVAAAVNNDVITLLPTPTNASIAMNAALYGKNVTITGTATVDWSKGFLFVGRGGAGNATLTFESANLTSASNQATYGIHVSGREKDTNDKYDGTLVINNSTIELDYLINKGTMTLDESTLTVKNGFSVGGRPAGETESGADATATITLNNNSKVVVNNHNGMGLGYEAIGVMDINSGSTFETTQSFLITAKGTMNNAGTVEITGTLTNNGTINFTGLDAKLTAQEGLTIVDKVNNPDYAIAYLDGTYQYAEYVAQIGDEKYLTLQEAIDAAQNDETITLLVDVNVKTPAYGQNALNHARAINFTLDLNDKTLSANTGNSVFRFNIANSGATGDVTVTIKNGTVVSGEDTWCTLMSSGISDDVRAVMNLEDLVIENYKGGDFAVKAWANGVVNAEGVTINSTYGGGFYAPGGEITLENCTVNQKGLWTAPYNSMAVAVSNGGKMTVNSGTYSAVPLAATDGNNQGTSHGSWTGGVMSSGGTLIINDGTFSNGNIGGTATYPRELFIVGADADYGDNVNGQVIINGGTFTSIGDFIHCETIWGSANDPANTYMPTMGVTITAGDFTAVAGKTIGGCDPVSTGNPVDVEISGGTYGANHAIDNSYLVVGYIVVDNGNGTYSVVEDQVAKIGDVTYKLLQEAIDAATDDATIVLIKSIEQIDGVLIENKNITIDLNEKTFTVTEGANTNNRNFRIIGTSVVTIKNGTMVAAGDYSSGAYGTVRTEGSANVTLTGLKLYNYRGNGLNIKALGGTTVDIENTEIYSHYGGGIEAAGGTITLAETVKVEQKGMYTAPYNSMAISVNGEGLVTVNGGTYSTECITAEEAGNQGSSHGPWVVGVLNSGGKLIINGGTFSNDNFGDNSLATAARGAVLADTKANVQINGGTFNALAKIIDIQNNLGDAANNPVVTLKGGTYSADPTNGNISNCIVLAWGYSVKPLDNGYYTVIQIAGTQTFNMEDAGWYWFSTYIKFDTEGEGLDALKYELDDDASLIKGQYAFTNYLTYNNTSFWTSGNNALTTLSPSQMYMINTTSDNVEVDLTGAFLDYEDVPVTINVVEGWNWIGYPVSEEVYINNAIPNAKQGDVIKSQFDGYAMYYDNYPYNDNTTLTGWYGELTTLKPGRGYMYQASEERQFSYNKGNGNGAKSNTIDYNGKNYWFADATQYPNNMSIVAMLSIDGEIVKGNYEVAAFANGECRGSARPIYIEAIDTYVLYMTIYGDEVEELTFMYYDIDKDTEYELSNVMNYSNDAIVGTLSDPYIFSMNILGIGENSIDNINIYPNPTTTDREINLQATCDKVEVFNALGVKVAEYHNVDTLDALETAGIYVIRITNDNAVKHCRLVVK